MTKHKPKFISYFVFCIFGQMLPSSNLREDTENTKFLSRPEGRLQSTVKKSEKFRPVLKLTQNTKTMSLVISAYSLSME
jgi:hypothetical protein